MLYFLIFFIDVKNERLPKSQITSVPRDEDEESDEDAETILKPHSKSLKILTNYKSILMFVAK